MAANMARIGLKKNIAVLPGDGIGPEVMVESLKVLKEIGSIFQHEFTFKEDYVGGAGYDKYGNHFSNEAKETCKNSDAVLFGSVGGPVDEQDLPKWKDAEKNAVLGLRKEYNFSINVRPAKIYPMLSNLCPIKDDIIFNEQNKHGVDMVTIRELLGGLYFGKHETVEDGYLARDILEYNKDQILLPMKFAFELAQKRRKKVTLVDKANVLDSSRLWRTVATEMVKPDFPDVELEFMYVDNAAMQLVRDPSHFDVVATENLFGDILSDISSVLPGSLGLMPSASLSTKGLHMFEPSGGSAPELTGLDVANPIAQILSGALMLRYSFNLEDEAKLIENAIEETLKDGYRTGDLIIQGAKDDSIKKVIGCKEMGDKIVEKIYEIHN